MGTRQLITVLEHIVAQRFDEKLIREKNGHLARDVLDAWRFLPSYGFTARKGINLALYNDECQCSVSLNI